MKSIFLDKVINSVKKVKGPKFLVFGLLLVSLVSFGAFFLTASNQAESSPISELSSKSEPKEQANTIRQSESASNSSGIGTKPGADNSSNSVGSSPQASNAPIATGSQDLKEEYRINVAVSGLGQFSLTLPKGSNHCDVLSRALLAGKIHQLDMRFNSGYGSYGVYKINNLGTSDQVWWTYRVNGVSPNKGCSYVAVNNYDQVAWEYIGPN